MATTQQVAFATDDGNNINQHFGRLRGFVVVTIENGIESNRTMLPRPDQADRAGDRRHNHVALLDPIAGCDVLVAGGMGLPMAEHVAERGIALRLTSQPSIEAALSGYIAGTLEHESNLAHQPRH